jgi:hypothetical protein
VRLFDTQKYSDPLYDDLNSVSRRTDFYQVLALNGSDTINSRLDLNQSYNCRPGVHLSLKQSTLMKSTKVFLLIIIIPFLTSCGVGTALVINQNQNTTQVHLGSANYSIVGNAVGSSEVEYIMLIGGLNKKQLYQNAYSDMVSKANLSGSKALINIITEEHVGGVPPFYVKRKITVSASIIEFNK